MVKVDCYFHGVPLSTRQSGSCRPQPRTHALAEVRWIGLRSTFSHLPEGLDFCPCRSASMAALKIFLLITSCHWTERRKQGQKWMAGSEMACWVRSSWAWASHAHAAQRHFQAWSCQLFVPSCTIKLLLGRQALMTAARMTFCD